MANLNDIEISHPMEVDVPPPLPSPPGTHHCPPSNNQCPDSMLFFSMKAAGLGKLKPNTLVLGFKSSWREGSAESLVDYVNTI